MADNDIYNNKGKWEFIVKNIKEYLKLDSEKMPRGKKRKYMIKNEENLKYFDKLKKQFGAKDLSYIRRIRLFRTFTVACHNTEKDLKDLERDDINSIVEFQHKVNKSPKSKHDFIVDLKHIWKTILPENDEKGRTDETIVPYVVRHLSAKIDKSKEKLKNDKLTIAEFENLVNSFSDNLRMQAFLTLALESLARPQELLYLKIGDVELDKNFATITISEHGKEGVGILRCIDSYFYVSKWFNKHPLKKNKNAYFFINTGNVNKYEQMTPFNVNRMIKDKLKLLKINKPVTAYSLKRNGVTMLRLRGESDLDIQHRARWSSTRQLKTYDLSTQEESFKIELIKRGIIKPSKEYKEYQPLEKKCFFCKASNGIAETFCKVCNRPLEKEIVEKELEESEAMKTRIGKMEKQLEYLILRQKKARA